MAYTKYKDIPHRREPLGGWDHIQHIENYLASGEIGTGVIGIGEDAVASIQSEINAAPSGSTVRLPPGKTIPVDGTIRLRSDVTLDLNGSTLRAVDNAAFETVTLGMDSVTGTTYNPAAIKPIIALIGTEGTPLRNAKVVNGTIDGNGTNQPDDGSYANVAVFWAEDCMVDVTSVNARPGITINDPDQGGANTGRRAFCLFIGNAARTTVHGTYIDSGYDAIGLRQGALDTSLTNVYAGKAAKGSIQIACGARRTRITDSLLDNTEGTDGASHSLFLHSAKEVTVTGTTLVNGGPAASGNAFAAFGDTTWGPTEDVTLMNCLMTHTQSVPLFAITTEHVQRVSATDITFQKSGSGQVISVIGAAKQISFTRWRGRAETSSSSVAISSAADIDFIDCDIEATSTGNPIVSLGGVNRARVRGGTYRAAGGPGVATSSSSSNVTIDGVRVLAADSVQALGGNTNIDIINCDFTGVTNANKLRIYGADSGLIRGNRGVVTEANGTATVPAAATSVTISHGLWVGTGTPATPKTDRLWLPRDFQVSFAGDPGSASRVWVSSVTTTQVTFTVDAAPGADVTLAWSAAMNRRTQA